MPELAKPDLEQLIPELLNAFDDCQSSTGSSSIRCLLETCPDLSDAAAHSQLNNIPSHLGQLIYIVPDSICPEEAIKQIAGAQVLATKNNFHIVSDCRAGPVLHLALGRNDANTIASWRHRCRSVFARLLGEQQWEMVFAERIVYDGEEEGTPTTTWLGLLRAGQGDEEGEEGEQQQQQRGEIVGTKMPTGCVDVWLAPVNRRIVAGCTKKVKKKVVRKVLRRSSREEQQQQQPHLLLMNGNNNSGSNGGQTTPTAVNGINNGSNEQKLQNGLAGKAALKSNGHDSSPSSTVHQNGIVPNGKKQQQQQNGGGAEKPGSIVGRIANLFNGMGSSKATAVVNGSSAQQARGRSQSLKEAEMQKATTTTMAKGNAAADTNDKLKRANSECATTATTTEMGIEERNFVCPSANDETSSPPPPTLDDGGNLELEEAKQQQQKQSPPRTPPKPLCVRIPVQQLSGGGVTFATSPQATTTTMRTTTTMPRATTESNGGGEEEAANNNNDVADDGDGGMIGNGTQMAEPKNKKNEKEEEQQGKEGGEKDRKREEEDNQMLKQQNVQQPASSATTSPSYSNCRPPSTIGIATNRPGVMEEQKAMGVPEAISTVVGGGGATVIPCVSPPSNHQSPPSAESGRGSSESPSSFHSTISDSPTLLARMPRNGFHREDAPSPSTSLIQSYTAATNVAGIGGNGGGNGGGAGTRRPFAGGIAIANGGSSSATGLLTTAAVGEHGTGSLLLLNAVGGGGGGGIGAAGGIGTNRLGPPSLGSVLSPISSCGSVEAQQEAELTALLMEQQQQEHHQHGGGEGGMEGGGIGRAGSGRRGGSAEAEDESTLMLLNNNHHRERGELSTLGGDDVDELSCSLRDDFSMASLISQRERGAGGGGAGGSGNAGAAHAHHQHLLLHNNKTTTTMRGMGQREGIKGGMGVGGDIVGGIGRSAAAAGRVHSPSPSKQGGVSVSPAPPMVRGMIGTFRMPVLALQQILSLFSYKEMGELRRVHPHWDELCGQLLNAAYSQLVSRAQWLLTDCQRRVHREPGMAQPIKLLTRVHVHVLNPVDTMLAFMDEGVLCFSYGALLDQAFAMLARVETMIGQVAGTVGGFDEGRTEEEYDEATVQLDQLAELARRAAHHYKQWVEPEAEKRMSELYRASAQQRLQRLDSFLTEHNVTRVGRESEKHRDELRWELEQLRHQSQQLKKENRELKQLCQKMDQRVEVLERKFKTMARLLQ